MNTYDIFAGKDLEIAELIQQRRYQILVHSCIYYVMSNNVISDKQWDEWAKELKTLQENYPEISKKTPLYDYFNDWDASTGEFLPIREKWVMNLASYVLRLNSKAGNIEQLKKVVKKTVRRKLF